MGGGHAPPLNQLREREGEKDVLNKAGAYVGEG